MLQFKEVAVVGTVVPSALLNSRGAVHCDSRMQRTCTSESLKDVLGCFGQQVQAVAEPNVDDMHMCTLRYVAADASRQFAVKSWHRAPKPYTISHNHQS